MKTNGSLRVLKYPELVGGLILIFFEIPGIDGSLILIFSKYPPKKEVGLWKIKEQHNTLLFSLVFS